MERKQEVVDSSQENTTENGVLDIERRMRKTGMKDKKGQNGAARETKKRQSWVKRGATCRELSNTVRTRVSGVFSNVSVKFPSKVHRAHPVASRCQNACMNALDLASVSVK
eukprot:6185830-Pleurochrysis_carterae.AAC.1